MREGTEGVDPLALLAKASEGGTLTQRGRLEGEGGKDGVKGEPIGSVVEGGESGGLALVPGDRWMGMVYSTTPLAKRASLLAASQWRRCEMEGMRTSSGAVPRGRRRVSNHALMSCRV